MELNADWDRCMKNADYDAIKDLNSAYKHFIFFTNSELAQMDWFEANFDYEGLNCKNGSTRD